MRRCAFRRTNPKAMSFVLHNAALCWMNLFVVQIVSTASSLFVGGDAAFSNKDKLQQAGQGKIGRTHTSIVRCILLQARTKKAKCPRQRRLTALARSVQKAARTPSDSQADSVDDYTKAKLKQGCSVPIGGRRVAAELFRCVPACDARPQMLR